MAETISKPIRAIRAIAVIVWHLLKLVWLMTFMLFGVFVLPGIVQYAGQFGTLPGLSSTGVFLSEWMPLFYLLTWIGLTLWLAFKWSVSLVSTLYKVMAAKKQ